MFCLYISREAYIASLTERLKESQNKLSMLKAQYSLPEFDGPLLSMPSLYSPSEDELEHESMPASQERATSNAQHPALNETGLFEEDDMEPAPSVEAMQLKQTIARLVKELKDSHQHRDAVSDETKLELESLRQQCQSMQERKTTLEKTVSVLQVKLHTVERDHAALVATAAAQQAEMDRLRMDLTLRSASFQSLTATHLRKLELAKVSRRVEHDLHMCGPCMTLALGPCVHVGQDD